jgi:hypothetical protein
MAIVQREKASIIPSRLPTLLERVYNCGKPHLQALLRLKLHWNITSKEKNAGHRGKFGRCWEYWTPIVEVVVENNGSPELFLLACGLKGSSECADIWSI